MSLHIRFICVSSVLNRVNYLTQVGRVAPRAPLLANRRLRVRLDGAHGVTRPTLPLFIHFISVYQRLLAV